MKKILLFALTVSSLSAAAQSSVLFINKDAKSTPIQRITNLDRTQLRTVSQKHLRAAEGWMSYQDAVAEENVATFSVYPIMHDSNAQIVPAAPDLPFNWWVNGLGTSFAATSTKFANPVHPLYVQNFQVTANDAFTIDSVNVLGFYNRNLNSGTDSLWIELASSGNVGVTNIQSGKSDWFNNNLGVTDSVIRWTSAAYDNVNNRMASNVVNKVSILVPMTAATVSDTDANGFNNIVAKLPTPLQVAAGQTVTAYVHFKTANPYPLNTLYTTINYFSMLTQESHGDNTFPKPVTGQQVNGLINTVGDRYKLLTATGANDYVSLGGVQYMGPTYWYGNTAGFDDPYFAFYVKCASCFSTGINDLNNSKFVSAYPNPASGVVSFNINVTETVNDANIEITNMVGQVVKKQTFANSSSKTYKMDISELSNGIYLYTINANGKKYTNRFSVSK